MAATMEPHVLLAQRRGGLTKLDIQDELAEYEMPKVQQGDWVLFYPSGMPTGRADMAQVSQLVEGANTIHTLYVPLGDFTAAEAVPHMDDPNLRLGGAHVENGAWDYTDKHKEELAFREEVRSRLKAMESQVSSPTLRDSRRTNKVKSTGLSPYQKLLARGKELGIPAIPKLSAEDLSRRIKEEEAKMKTAVEQI